MMEIYLYGIAMTNRILVFLKIQLGRGGPSEQDGIAELASHLEQQNS